MAESQAPLPGGKTGWFSNLKGDLFGGVTAGVIALPLALAFGVSSGLGPAAGMYGAIAVGVLAAAFGGTPSQISGPTGPMTVVVAGAVAAMTGDPALIFVAIALAGLMQIAFGLLRLGGFIRYMPYPVVSGFMSGIGVIIIALQLLPMLGAPGAASVIGGLKRLPDALVHTNVVALGLGLAAIALVYATKAIAPKVPGALVSLIGLTIAAWALRLDVPHIGTIPTGLPALHLPPLDPFAIAAVVPTAFMLAALGCIDSLLTSVVADNVTRTRHDSDKELIGQGIGNAVAGLIGGVPGAGATMRTVANIQAGGRTPLSGIVHGLLLLAIMLGLAPLAANIPLAVLAGILVTVGIGIVDYRGLTHFWRVPRADAVVMGVVLVMTVFVDLIQAVAAGMVMASLIFVKRMSDMEVAVPTSVGGGGSLDEDADQRPREVLDDIYVVPVSGSLFFGNALPLQGLIMGLTDARAIVLDLSDTPFLDQSAAYAISDVALDLGGKGIALYICGLRDQPRRILRLTGIAPGELPKSQIFDDCKDAVLAAAGPEALGWIGGLGVMGAIDLSTKSGILELPAPAALVGQSLGEAQIRQRYGVNVVGILRGGVVDAAPHGSTRIEAGDVLALVGPTERLQAFERG